MFFHLQEKHDTKTGRSKNPRVEKMLFLLDEFYEELFDFLNGDFRRTTPLKHDA